MKRTAVENAELRKPENVVIMWGLYVSGVGRSGKMFWWDFLMLRFWFFFKKRNKNRFFNNRNKKIMKKNILRKKEITSFRL